MLFLLPNIFVLFCYLLFYAVSACTEATPTAQMMTYLLKMCLNPYCVLFVSSVFFKKKTKLKKNRPHFTDEHVALLSKWTQLLL